MLLEGLKAWFEGSQQWYGYIGLVAFLKCICDNFPLAGDAVLALCDEPFSLG
jgi:hypothetical protein